MDEGQGEDGDAVVEGFWGEGLVCRNCIKPLTFVPEP